MAQKNVYHTDIAILGGGAAGLIAAVSAARCSGGKIKIAVVEKTRVLGKAAYNGQRQVQPEQPSDFPRAIFRKPCGWRRAPVSNV